MATITPELEENEQNPGVRTAKWENCSTSDTINATQLANLSDKTMTVTGTFNGGTTVGLEGSNDGTTFFDMKDAQGNDISFTAAGMSIVLENPLYVRPKVTSGSSDSVTVIIAAKG